MKFKLKEKKALKEYKDELSIIFPSTIQSIILFGSKARGDDNADSDIDALLLVKNNNRKFWKKAVDLSADLLYKYDDVLISPKIRTKKEMARWSPLHERIKKEGIEIWNRSKKRNLLG